MDAEEEDGDVDGLKFDGKHQCVLPVETVIGLRVLLTRARVLSMMFLPMRASSNSGSNLLMKFSLLSGNSSGSVRRMRVI